MNILSMNGGASELGCQHLVRVGVTRERVQNDTKRQPRDGVLSTVNHEKGVSAMNNRHLTLVKRGGLCNVKRSGRGVESCVGSLASMNSGMRP